MPPKNNTRKAGMKKIEGFCSKRAKKTMKVMQKIRPVSAKNLKARTEEFTNSCAKRFEFKNGKWVPKCDQTAKQVTSVLVEIGKKLTRKSPPASEKKKIFNEVKKKCLKEYSL